MTSLMKMSDGNFIGVPAITNNGSTYTNYSNLKKGRLTKIDSNMNILFDVEVGTDYYKLAGLNFIDSLENSNFIVGGA